MRNTAKMLSLVLCAVLCIGVLPVGGMAEGMEEPEEILVMEEGAGEQFGLVTGLSAEQISGVLNRPMSNWYFPLAEEYMDDVIDFAGCRGWEEAPLYGSPNYDCQFSSHSGFEYGSPFMAVRAPAGAEVYAPVGGVLYRGYDNDMGHVAIIEQSLGDGYSYYVVLANVSDAAPASHGSAVAAGNAVASTSGSALRYSAVMGGSGLGNQLAGAPTQELGAIWACGWLTESRGVGMICVNPSYWTDTQYKNQIVGSFPGPIVYGFVTPSAPEPEPPTMEIPTEEQHTHVFDQQIAEPQFLYAGASCGTAATYYYSCACGETGGDTFTFGVPGEHTFSTEWSSDEGYHWHASTCGHTEVTGDFGEHVWSEGNTIQAASHTASGLVSYTCTVCGRERTESVLPSDGHVFDQQNTDAAYLVSPANCATPAQYVYSCVCGEKGTETFASGTTADHVWDVQETPPTHTADGVRTTTCTVCGTSSSEGIPAITDHTYDQQNTAPEYLATPGSCTEAPTYYYSCICGAKGTQTFSFGVMNGHTFAAEWSKDDNQHWHAATCGHTDQLGDLAAHTWDQGQYLTQPTHTTAGEKAYTCTVCGQIRKEIVPASSEHVFDQRVTAPEFLKTAASCSGPAEYYMSCLCGQRGEATFQSGTALDHTFSTEWSKDANAHWHAATCGHSEVKDYDIHAWGSGNATVQPSHTAEGMATYTCTVCGESKTEPVPPMSHVFDQQIVDDRYLVSPASCTQGAVYYLSCTCGEKGTETFTAGEAKGHTFANDWSRDEKQHWIAATCEHTSERIRVADHIWNQGVITVQPTAASTGVKTYTCTVCGATRTESVPASAHAHTYSNIWAMDSIAHWQTATCEHTREIANYSLHVWNNGVVSKAATHYSNGEMVYTCAVCGQIRTEVISAAHVFDQKVVSAAFQKSPATCVSAAQYYVSCTCGAKGTDTFFYGQPQGHTYASSWTKDTDSHYHACLICQARGESQPHSFAQNSGVCLICGYTTQDAHNHTVHLTKINAKSPTCTEDGNTAYYSCSCGEWFTDYTAAVTINDHSSVIVPASGHVDSNKDGRCDTCGQRLETMTVEYNVLEGAESTWVNNSNQGLVFRASSEYSSFHHVEVDGVTVAAENYVVGEGSTIVELKASYMKRLTIGRHTISIVAKDGKATTSFTVKQAAATTASQESGGGLGWLIIAFLALLVLIGTGATVGYLIYTGKLGGKKGKYSR